MEELSKRAETLLRELLINENQLFEYLKDKFEKVERLEKDDSKLRFTLSELIEKGYFNCFWADNIPYSPSLSHLADEYFEAESSKELDFNKDIMITILREVANEFNIANVFFWDVPSCGRSQIGWEQIDELEWRVKVEAHDFINISRASKQIENKLRLYNYISTDSERIEKGTRKVIVQNYKHKSIASLDKTDKIDDDSIIESLIESCLRLQAYKLIKSASEDDISTYIRDMLTSKGIQVLDQTRRGKSATGKQAGELDLLIVDDKNRPVLIIEAFKLSSLERKNIDLHIDKVGVCQHSCRL